MFLTERSDGVLTTSMKSRHTITAAVLAGLFIVGCASSVSRTEGASNTEAHDTVDTAQPPDTAVETATSGVDAGGSTGGGGGGVVTTAKSGAPATTTTALKLTPVTKAAPPATTTTAATMATLPSGSLSLPRIVSLDGTTNFACAQLPLTKTTPVTWTSYKATSVRLSIDSSRPISGLAANGKYSVPLKCGDTQTVTVTAIGSDGLVGGSKTIVITVGA